MVARSSGSPKIISPSKPSECTAALTLSGDDPEAPPYMAVLYTAHEGRIMFYAFEVVGTETVPAESDLPASERIMYRTYGTDGEATTSDPDNAAVLVQGSLYKGAMCLDSFDDCGYLETADQATNFITAIRYVYSMAAQGTAEADA